MLREEMRTSIRATRANVETGRWCAECQLPSAVRTAALIELGGEPLGILEVERCAGCGGARRVE